MATLRTVATVGCLTVGLGDFAYLDLGILPAVLTPPVGIGVAIARSDHSPRSSEPRRVSEPPSAPVLDAHAAEPRWSTASSAALAATIHFGLDRDDVSQLERRSLQRIAARLTGDPRLSARVDGHTDSRGSEEHNDQLSQARADAVAAVLVELGVARRRITTYAFGQHRPLPGSVPDGDRRNRRAEIRLASLQDGSQL